MEIPLPSDLDEIDLRIMEAIVEKPDATFKDLSRPLNLDQRTIANRVKVLRTNMVLKLAYEVDWRKLGFTASAYVGSTTALGEKSVTNLSQFMRKDPRIVEAYETVGAHQYLMRVIETDLPSLRDSVLKDLEPLTADLTTTLVTSEIKRRDYLSLLRYYRGVRYPRSVAHE
jgi:DNA-binding Lrp family transcriptional regulator